MARQMDLIPVSDAEFTCAAYELAKLLNQLDEAEAAWTEAKEAHKQTKAALTKAVHKQRAVIRRREQEQTEGITQR